MNIFPNRPLIISFTLIVGSLISVDRVVAFAIPLQNPGFEIPEQTNEPVAGAGFFDFETPPGWSLYDPNGLIPEDASLATSFTGGWKPSAAFFPTIPEGDQIGSIFLVPPGAGAVGFSQNTSATIQPNTTYTLSAAILNTPSGLPNTEFFQGFPGYRLELLAGNTVIAADDNTVIISDGELATASVSYTSSINDIYLGEILSIRLINLNLDNGSGVNGGNGIEVNFDNVQLTATTVPEPSLLTMIGASAALGFARFFKQKISKNKNNN